MKHLKFFEKFGYYDKDVDDLDIGDYVILLTQNNDTEYHKFVVGKTYHITLTDYGDEKPYEISELTKDCGAWVNEDEIRPLTKSEIEQSLEISQIKYNL